MIINYRLQLEYLALVNKLHGLQAHSGKYG